jgi:phasin family protein
MLNFENILATQKSAVAGLFDLSNSLFGSAESLVRLNLQAAKATLQEAADASQTLAGAQNPQAFVELQSQALKAAPEKAASYLRHVQSIVTSSGNEVREYVEAAASDAKAEISSFVEAAAKNAPAGSENAVALVKSAVAAATNAIESAQQVAKKATDKAVETVEATLEAKA